MKFDLPKIVTIIIWLLVIANFFVAFPDWANTALNGIGIFLVAAHLIEYVVFNKRIAEKPEGKVLAFVMTFFFGVLYWKSDAAEAEV